MNSEKTIFIKRQGDNFIIHGLFLDDMMQKEYMEKYTRDFDITGGGLMETFLGIQVEQSKGRLGLRLHLDNYILEILDEYKLFQTKSLGPKLVLIQPGLVLTKDDCPIVVLSQGSRSSIDHSSLNFNLLLRWFGLISRLQWHSGLVSVHRRGNRTGLLFII
jgi:hypothetical protein